jgi:uncharacterized membrane protein YkvA (DUF1232 family)
MASNRDIVPSQGGALKELLAKLKLIARLMADSRVPALIKLIPIGALAYVVSPVDLVPGVTLPVIGALDDVAVLWLGAKVFIELSPPNVVAELTERLMGENTTADSGSEVIDGEVTDVTREK